MATIVNTPAQTTDSGAGAGWVVAIIVLLVLAALVYFGFNTFRGGSALPSTANINVSLPSTGGAGAATK